MRESNIPESIVDAEYDMDLLRLMKGTTFLWILSGNESERENGSVLSKGCDYPKDTSQTLLYPPTLGTIPLVIGPHRP